MSSGIDVLLRGLQWSPPRKVKLMDKHGDTGRFQASVPFEPVPGDERALFLQGCRRKPNDRSPVLEKHTNARGTVHGGLLATIADIVLGYAAAFSRDPPLSLVTSTLSIDFAGTAKLADWIEARADIQRVGKRMAYVKCLHPPG